MTIYPQQPTAPVDIRPVSNRREMKQFINLPGQLYKDVPLWVPPLALERRLHFSTLNPFFKHAEWQAWLASRNNRVVGRICAQIDHVHRQHHGAHTGHFGLLEAENDPAIFKALLDTSEDWLSQRQTQIITGPFNFSINQECGILVDGFDTPPVVMMPHSREWYDQSLQAFGYRPARDLLAYWVNVDFEAPRIMNSLLNRFRDRVRIRPLKRKNFSGEMEILRDLFNDAWSGNWGFVPFNREEFADMGNSLRPFLPDDFVQIAEIDDNPVAFIVALPNLNEILKQLDGKLLPFGWLRLINSIRQRKLTTGRIPLMGVRKIYQNSPLGIALAFMVIDAVRQALLAKSNIREVEMSWILEDNKGMRSILDSIGSRQYKRYRIYEKALQVL